MQKFSQNNGLENFPFFTLKGKEFSQTEIQKKFKVLS